MRDACVYNSFVLHTYSTGAATRLGAQTVLLQLDDAVQKLFQPLADMMSWPRKMTGTHADQRYLLYPSDYTEEELRGKEVRTNGGQRLTG